MAQKLLDKLFSEAYKSNVSYVAFTIADENVAYKELPEKGRFKKLM